MTEFQINDPSLESQWRALILFGKNSATYKFAFAKSLLELIEKETTSISLKEFTFKPLIATNSSFSFSPLNAVVKLLPIFPKIGDTLYSVKNDTEKISKNAKIIFAKGPASATNDFSTNEHELKNLVDN